MLLEVDITEEEGSAVDLSPVGVRVVVSDTGEGIPRTSSGAYLTVLYD